MPYYVFVNHETQEYRDVFFQMNDLKEYFGSEEEIAELGKSEWKRVYSAPQMAIDVKVNPFSGKDFVRKTQNAKTYGELFDLSQQRESKLGAPDPQTEKAKENFYKPKKQQ
jgi:hypothetical protein